MPLPRYWRRMLALEETRVEVGGSIYDKAHARLQRGVYCRMPVPECAGRMVQQKQVFMIQIVKKKSMGER